jgi:uncharacterized protein YdeI (YjbR/CyaY-like superfamily)
MSSEVSIFEAGTADDWRAWLAGNCRSAKEVWLVLRHHDSGTPSLRYHEAVEQALCFGWIDGLHRRYGADSSRLRFTPRTARSRWSQLNRQRAAKMIELGLMTEHGQTAIERAKAAGTWQLLPDEPRWAIPDDLQALLDGNDTARTNFESFPPSSKRLILEWIAISKRPDTRQRRIDQTVNLAALNIRANHPRDMRACPTLLRVSRLEHLAPPIVSTIVACPFAHQRRHRDRAIWRSRCHDPKIGRSSARSVTAPECNGRARHAERRLRAVRSGLGPRVGPRPDRPALCVVGAGGLAFLSAAVADVRAGRAAWGPAGVRPGRRGVSWRCAWFTRRGAGGTRLR